jgi:SAM-dependent methyltransferase
MRFGAKISDGLAIGYRRGFDSGEMLDYVYENRARGRFLIGRLVDRIYLDSVGWRGIRNRRRLLKSRVRAAIYRRRDGLRTTRIVDMASGPARYLLETLQETGDAGVEVLCRDMDESGLARGRALAIAFGANNVRYERGDAFSAQSIAAIDPKPDVIIVSGLYELFSDHAMIVRSLAALREAAAHGATILVTTQVAHPQLDLIANVLPNREGVPWIMECRPVALTEQWLLEAGFTIVGSETEPLGLFALTEARAS